MAESIPKALVGEKMTLRVAGTFRDHYRAVAEFFHFSVDR